MSSQLLHKIVTGASLICSITVFYATGKERKSNKDSCTRVRLAFLTAESIYRARFLIKECTNCRMKF